VTVGLVLGERLACGKCLAAVVADDRGRGKLDATGAAEPILGRIDDGCAAAAARALGVKMCGHTRSKLTRRGVLGPAPPCARSAVADDLGIFPAMGWSASIRVLIDMMGAAGFSAPEALVFDGPDPFPGSAVP
jgi:hypothetical protein